MAQIIQCVPNFSEGRRPDVIAEIVRSAEAVPGVRVADWSADSDHNRMVVTLVGPLESVREAALGMCAVAIQTIDLRTHQGVHPRLGALDVLPFVPLADITLDECAVLAHDVGLELAERFDLPVFLYEAASPELRSLPFVRREAFETLTPDFGPFVPHPTAGASVVGARGPLIAYNIHLATPNLRVARTIARELREGGGAGFVGVRALGLTLPSRNVTQVSLNITRPAEISLLAVFQYVARRAQDLGTLVTDSEVIGALPGFTAFGVITEALQAIGLQPNQILLENWPSLE